MKLTIHIVTHDLKLIDITKQVYNLNVDELDKYVESVIKSTLNEKVSIAHIKYFLMNGD